MYKKIESRNGNDDKTDNQGLIRSYESEAE
jgi:hypothetical protein